MILLNTNFNLPSTSGKNVSLDDYKGKYLVLYFYPKDNTSGCTLEANQFSENYSEFKKAGAEIVGISKDSIASHNRFKEKENIPFELLSDTEREVHNNFEVLKPAKMYGKDVIKTVRSTFIFDKEGNLIKEYRDVKARDHALEVLEFIKSL
ncbi:peroxiredoxin [Anaerosphaera multitolerans]|uniref:thioredoxin-dependent peroxiredoxin n=1 Tax=Anaerosphaera multitolerans TaxID=2487351 RepID=A0A437S7Y0_9FIRM|nr:peroxiredoxin [Anaerosphaera multitolerans]RVU55189.1 peroxiredoxin [Anaerosphaera multitolerans]